MVGTCGAYDLGGSATSVDQVSEQVHPPEVLVSIGSL
jgi:hypothetical protein